VLSGLTDTLRVNAGDSNNIVLVGHDVPFLVCSANSVDNSLDASLCDKLSTSIAGAAHLLITVTVDLSDVERCATGVLDAGESVTLSVDGEVRVVTDSRGHSTVAPLVHANGDDSSALDDNSAVTVGLNLGSLSLANSKVKQRTLLTGKPVAVGL